MFLKKEDVLVFLLRKGILSSVIALVVFFVLGSFSLLREDVIISQSLLVKKTTTRLKIQKKKKIPAEVILAEEILRVSKLPEFTKRIDRKVFSEDFLLAIQYKESRFNKKAVSSAGAQGGYQITPVATQEVVKYQNNLNTEGVIDDYSGPEEISLAMAKKIGNRFQVNPEYDRAIALTFLQNIYESYSNTGKNSFLKKSVAEKREMVLNYYHAGNKKALRANRVYVHNIFGYMKTISFIRHELKKIQYPWNKIDFEIAKIMREAEVKDFSKKHLISRLAMTQSKRNFSA